MTTNPCIKCLTYICCKNKLIKAMIEQMRLTQSFNTNLYTPYQTILYRSANSSLLSYCPLIETYTNGIFESGISYNHSILKSINEAFNVLDEEGQLYKNFPFNKRIFQ